MAELAVGSGIAPLPEGAAVSPHALGRNVTFSEVDVASCKSSDSETSTVCSDSEADKIHFEHASSDLLFLNVPSFAGGADPWGWATRFGTHDMADEDRSALEVRRQDFGDGRLE